MAERQQPDAMVRALLQDDASPETMLVDALLTRALEGGRLDYELLAGAALPRRFDSDALSSLTRLGADDSEFTDAFRRLTELPFVHERHGGTWAVHDSVRGPLLDHWSNDTLEGLDHDQTVQTLVAHYDGAYRRGRAAKDALARVSTLIRTTDEQRYRIAIASVDDEVVRPAVEAQHLALRLSPEAGRKRFSDTFIELEADRAWNAAETVLAAFELDAANTSGVENVRLEHWADYFRARLANDRRDWDQAETYLDRLADVSSVDPVLASWTASTRSNWAFGQSKWDEQFRALDEGIAFIEQNDVDPWNANVLWVQKANAHQALWDWEGEVAACARALELAVGAENWQAAVQQRCSLAASHDSAGQLEMAADYMLAAVLEARQLRQRRPNVDATATVMAVFGRRSRRMLHFAAQQSRHLRTVQGSEALIEIELRSATVLAGGGAHEDARAAFDEAEQLAREDCPHLVFEIQASRAGARLEDDVTVDIDRGLQLLGETIVDPWDLGRVSTNAALALKDAGKLDDAAEVLDIARAHWQTMDHRRAVAYTHAIEGDLLRRKGDYVGAEAALDRAGDHPARGYDAPALEIRGRLADDRGDYADAAELLRVACDRTPADNPGSMMERILLGATYAAHAGQFAGAAELSERGARVAQELEAFATWIPSDDVRTADEYGARAIESLVSTRTSASTTATAAREHLRMAIDADPEFGWFWLELAALDLIANDLKQARQHLETAADRIGDDVIAAAIRRRRDSLMD